MAGLNPTEPLFVGRRQELHVLRDVLVEVRAGRTRTVVVDGAPGIGKSALLRRFVETASDVRLLDASGIDAETTVPWGVVEQLVRSTGLSASVLPPALASPGPDPPTVGAAFVLLTSLLDRHGPVVVVIDDAHWADVASLHALTFALRRLRHDQVLAVVATRTEERDHLPDGLLRLADGPHGQRLTLGGLEDRDLAELAATHGVALSRSSAARLQRHTGGNPLYARTLLEEAAPGELQDVLDVPLPAPRRFAQRIRSRLERCPRDSRDLVAAAAVLGARCSVEVAARLAGVPDPLEALEPAVEAGLVTAERADARLEMRFTHGLIRAAVYHDLGPARVAGLHRRAAAILDDERAVLRHRAAATPGHDDVLARDLEEFAQRERSRSAWASASEAFARAARLSTDRTQHQERMLEAIDTALIAGDAPTIEHLVSRIDPAFDSPRRRYVMARLAMVTSTWEHVERLIESAWEACHPHRDPDRDPDSEDSAPHGAPHTAPTCDPDLAGRIANVAAMVAANDGRGADALHWAERTLRLSETPPPDAVLSLLLGSYTLGRTEEIAELLRGLPERVAEVPPARTDTLLGRGVIRLWDGDVDGAIADLTAVHRVCARRGPFHTGNVALFYLADAQFRAGDWDGAITSAETAASATADADQTWFGAFVHAAAAFPLAARGADTAAEEHVAAARAAAEARGDMAAWIWAACAAARLAHARDDPGGAPDALAPVRHYRSSDGGRDPGMQPWMLLWCEALVRVGRTDEAAELLASVEEGEERAAVLAQTCRLRGMLLAAEGARSPAWDAFRTGLRHAETTRTPFVRARLEASYGVALRRGGQRRAAAEHLTAARQRFAVLGAEPYIARCDRELAACGYETGPGDHGPQELTPQELTPQELAVAHLVASGATNREAAEELVVSPKTIEYHLGNIYRKLAVRSRTQLAVRLNSADPDRD
jgi:ATP/maltotriose-dependent transcriptional regulator MalT